MAILSKRPQNLSFFLLYNSKTGRGLRNFGQLALDPSEKSKGGDG
jgi:hypothetical protein